MFMLTAKVDKKKIILALAAVAVLIVMLIMIIRYRMAGIVADWALVIYIILLFLLLVPNDGVPEITVPPTTTEETLDNTEVPTESEGTIPTETERTMLPKMAQLYAENPDVIGWITIPDTKVDYTPQSQKNQSKIASAPKINRAVSPP